MVTGFDIIGSDKNLQEHWIRRFVAYIIDIAIVSIAIWIIFWVILGWQKWIEVGLLSGVLILLYFTVLEATTSKTIGKAILGLEVNTAAGYMDFSKSIIRNISKFFWYILPFLDWVIGMATEGDPRQRFLDRMAGTTVTYAYGAGIGYSQGPAASSISPTGQTPTEKCAFCGAPLHELDGGRYQCSGCGIIQ